MSGDEKTSWLGRAVAYVAVIAFLGGFAAAVVIAVFDLDVHSNEAAIAGLVTGAGFLLIVGIAVFEGIKDRGAQSRRR